MFRELRFRVLHAGPPQVPGSFSRLLWGGGVALAINVMAVAGHFLLNVLFAHWLGIGGFGRFVYGFSWAQVLAVLVTAGLGAAALRFVPEYLRSGDFGPLRGFLTFGRAVPVGVGVAVAGAGVALLRLLGPNARMATVLAMGMVLVPLLAVVTFQGQFLRGAGRIGYALGSQNLGPPVMGLLLGGCLWIAGHLNPESALAAMGAGCLVVAWVQSFWIRRSVPSPVFRAAIAVKARYWLRVSVPMLVVVAFTVALAKTGILVVGAIAGARNAGLYAAASRVASLVGFFLTAVNAIAAPDIARLFQEGDENGLLRLATRVSWLAFVPSLGVAALLFVFRVPVLRLFGGGFESASTVLVVLLVGALVNALTGPVGYLLMLTGLERRAAGIYGTAAIINLAASVSLTITMGILGAALATAASTVLWNVLCLREVRRTLRLSYTPLGYPGRGKR